MFVYVMYGMYAVPCLLSHKLLSHKPKHFIPVSWPPSFRAEGERGNTTSSGSELSEGVLARAAAAGSSHKYSTSFESLHHVTCFAVHFIK